MASVAEALLRLVLHEERRAEGVAVMAMAIGEALADFSGDWVWRRWGEARDVDAICRT